MQNWTKDRGLLDQMASAIVMAIADDDVLSESKPTEDQLFWFMVGWLDKNVSFCSNNERCLLRINLESLVDKKLQVNYEY